MKWAFAAAVLACMQLNAVRTVFAGSPDDDLGGFSIQLDPGWRAKLPSAPLDKHTLVARSGEFYGPKNEFMTVLWMLKPTEELLRAVPKELTAASTKNRDDYRDVTVKGRTGAIYVQVSKGRGPRDIWVIAKLTDGREIVNVTIKEPKRPNSDQLDRIEAMVRSLDPYRG